MLIMNLKSWNKLPKELQDLIMNRMLEFEVEQVPVEIAKSQEAIQKMKDVGVEFYKFSPEMAKWYHDKIYDSSWKHEEERFGSVVTDFKKLMPK
jgi:TRAP-type C4-dicarboxylate transport system substrate-binding protein